MSEIEVDIFDRFKRTEKQREAWKLFSRYRKILLYGGARSGKSFLIIVALIWRSLFAPGSSHLVLRKTFKDCRKSIFNKTLLDALKLIFPVGAGYHLNKSDSIVEFENGSKIFCEGLDENRLDSILGNEYSTIYFNEVSEIPFSVIETVESRLAEVKKTLAGRPLTKRIFYDCNPPKRSHWVYKQFFKKINPVDNSPLKYPDDLAQLQINPIHNIDHLGEDYLEKTLGQMSKSKQLRFLKGEFGDDTEGALWRQSWIDETRAKWDHKNNRWIVPDFIKVVTAVDPAVTSNPESDETGIITVGTAKDEKGDVHYYVLSDGSDIYPVAEWARVSLSEYAIHKADRIIGEVNNGGDLVERNIQAEDPSFRGFKPVRATRGKEVRAEPVSTIYEKGFVHHVGIFPDLEDELTSWVPGEGKSPNRLDALVWAITYLMDKGQSDKMKLPDEPLY